MGKKYYGGIGTDKGFVMHSPESKYHYSRDDEFHKEGDKRDVGSTSNTGGGNSSNDSTHNESSDESHSSAQSNFDAPYDDDRNNRDDELDDFFGDLLSIKACIALAIEGLFKAFMSRSMKRIDFVAVTLMLLVCMRVIGAVFIDSSSLSELNAFAFVVALSALGMCTISEKCPANALTTLVIACLPALIEVVTACAVNGSDADAFNRITNWALVGCLGSAALLIAGTLIDPFSDEEEDEDEDASMDGGRGTSASANEGEGEGEGASMHEKASRSEVENEDGSTGACEDETTTTCEDAACERVFFIPFWGAAIGATAALIWELAPYIAREIAYGAAPLYLSYMGWIV
ncbi:hypothetical protein [Slackia sp.]|uniref:hypothetical protein n=1 Tax=Slackia sp. TaxID=2049041 RepID=UPI00257E2847|nr:hypothetical protein [Slackia sp.]MBS6499156.1 hypothetical protein [Slackia sp.]